MDRQLHKHFKKRFLECQKFLENSVHKRLLNFDQEYFKTENQNIPGNSFGETNFPTFILNILSLFVFACLTIYRM